MKPAVKQRGFTLIEVIIAVALASSTMVMIVYMVVASIDLRRKASILNQSVFLAENILNSIKNQDTLPDKEGDMEGYPGYSYSYSSKEIEYDPFTGIAEGVDTKEQKLVEQYRQGQSTGLSTGLLFRMRQYNVTIFYHEKYIYELECLRGLKLEQTK